MNNMTVLEQWQYVYCAGAPMSLSFRINASKIFQECYNKIKTVNLEYGNVLQVPKILYRILAQPFEIQMVDKNLYYSFSGSPQGILYFAKKDKYLHSDITLIIAKPQEALDYNALCGYSSKFGQEEEIVSKLRNENIVDIRHFQTINELEDYFNNQQKADQ